MYLDYLNNREKEINERMRRNFKYHKAEVIECGPITVLNWKAPGTGCFYIRYVFDGRRLYITGDVGDAIVEFSNEISVHSFKNISTEYFFRKMLTSSDGMEDFESELAVMRLEEWKEDYLENVDFDEDYDKEYFIDNIDTIIGEAQGCNSILNWNYTIGEYNEIIYEYNLEEEGWIHDIGTVTPYRNYAFLVGLQMASEQLRKTERWYFESEEAMNVAIAQEKCIIDVVNTGVTGYDHWADVIVEREVENE